MNSLKLYKYFGPLLVASLTALGYFCAYKYESGYLGYFSVPSALMELSASVIIYSAGVVFATLAFAAGMFVFRPKENEQNPSLQHRKNKLIVYFLVVIYMIMLFGPDVKEYWWLLIVLGFLLIFDWGWPALVFRDRHKTFGEKVIADDEAESKNITFSDLVAKHLGPEIIILIIFGYLVGFFAYYHGRADAKKETTFYIIESGRPQVALRIYNNKIIIAPIDKQKKTIQPQYSIIKVESDSIKRAIELKRENVGPLRMGK